MVSIAALRRRLRLMLRPLPDRLPDFLVLGATRSGSTFLHSALGEHPDVFVPPVKELRYFNRDDMYEPSLRAYRRHFGDYAGQKRVGESTPLYLSKGVTYTRSGDMRFDAAEDAVVRIARHLPDAQLIISLRDPLTRMVSEHEKNVGQGKHSIPIDEILLAELSGERSRRGLLYHNEYERHLRHVFDHFSEEKVRILVFEEWIENPRAALASLRSFLGIDEIDLELAQTPQNRRSKYIAANRSGERPSSAISPEVCRAVLDHLQPSREYLEKLLGRKLPWTDQTTNR